MEFRDGDIFCFAHFQGYTLIGVVSKHALDQWEAGKPLWMQHPRRVTGNQQGGVGLTLLHPIMSPQSDVRIQGCALEEIGEITGNGGSCTECAQFFVEYVRIVGQWQAQLSGIVMPDRPPIQLAKG